MERKNVFAGVVLLTALLSASSVFAAAEQPGLLSKIGTALAAVKNVVVQNKMATATAVTTVGLGYLASVVRGYGNLDGADEELRKGSAALAAYLTAGATVAGCATIALAQDVLKAACNQLTTRPPRIVYSISERAVESEHSSSSSSDSDSDSDEEQPEVAAVHVDSSLDADGAKRLYEEADLAARAVAGDPVPMSPLLVEVMGNAVEWGAGYDGRGNPVIRTSRRINGKNLFARNDDQGGNDAYPVSSSDVVNQRQARELRRLQ